METPRVLVLLIVKNEIETISECVNSILAQNTPVQVLVSDNLSRDGTYEFLQSFSSDSENFHLIQPPRECSIPAHFKFLVESAEKLFPDIPYRILLGGDDSYSDTSLLQTLLNSIIENKRKEDSDSVIAVPAITLYNCSLPQNSFDVDSIRFLQSKWPLVRVFGLSITPTQFGYFNFVLGLMETHVFRYWSSILLERHEKEDFVLDSKRNILPEYLASYQLLFQSKVIFSPEVRFFKRQHNRNELGERQNNSLAAANHSKVKLSNWFNAAIHQLNSFTTTLRTAWRYRKQLTLKEFAVLSLCGILATLSNTSHLIYRLYSREK